MLHIPNKRAIQYTGDTPYVFREEQSRERPTLQKGDTVVCSIYTAAILVRKGNFKYVDIGQWGENITSAISVPAKSVVEKAKEALGSITGGKQ